MDQLRWFLNGREVYSDCGSGMHRVSVDQALELMNKCTVYASLTKEGKATPAISIEAENDVSQFALINVAGYVVQLLRSLGIGSAYITFHWIGANVLIDEEVLPSEVFKSGADAITVARSISNHLVKVLANKLLKISNFFRGRLWFSTNVDMVVVPCSLVPRTGRKAILIGIEAVEKLLESGISDEMCIVGDVVRGQKVGTPFINWVVSKAIRTAPSPAPLTIRSRTASQPKVVGRFEIMALLQCARYYVLSKDLEKSKSFGLNRAIFYAWAKHHKPKTRAPSANTSMCPKPGLSNDWKVVDDEVEMSDGYFVFSDQVQTPADFDRTVKHKIDAVVPFEIAWNYTLKYISMFSHDVLRDPNKFYKHVYEPVRDCYLESLEQLVDLATLKGLTKELTKPSAVHNVYRVPPKPAIRRIDEYFKQ